MEKKERKEKGFPPQGDAMNLSDISEKAIQKMDRVMQEKEEIEMDQK